MKKTALILGILFATPFVVFGYVGEDLQTIELRYSESKHTHEIIYRMNDGVGLKSNLTTTARNEERTYNRLWNVTKNTPAFEDYAMSDIKTMFDWNTFNERRSAVHALVDAIIATGSVDTTTAVTLALYKETY